MDILRSQLEVFCKEVCEERRYFYSSATLSFLDDLYTHVTSTRKHAVKSYYEGSTFYRARAHEFTNKDNMYKKEPFSCSEMKPIANIRANGRLNAYNINALYLAEDQYTAVSEVRASTGAPISVAKFKANKKLEILRFDYTSDADCGLNYSNPDITYDLAFMFSQPFDNPEHQNREYIPTQIIAEYFRSKGIDGIEYPSQFTSINKAEVNANTPESISSALKQEIRFNLCLFDISAADCVPGTIEVLALTKRVNIVGKY
jgi:RES domain-containing protein